MSISMPPEDQPQITAVWRHRRYDWVNPFPTPSLEKGWEGEDLSYLDRVWGVWKAGEPAYALEAEASPGSLLPQ